jgi:hypothetical protein
MEYETAWQTCGNDTSVSRANFVKIKSVKKDPPLLSEVIEAFTEFRVSFPERKESPNE